MLSLAYLLFSLSLVGVHALPQPQGAPTNPGFPGEPGGGATATKTVTVTATPASPSDPGAITGAANLGPLGGAVNAGLGTEGGHGHAQGSAGPFSGIIGGEVGPDGNYGCAGGAFEGFGYTACLPSGTTVPMKEREAAPAPTAAP